MTELRDIVRQLAENAPAIAMHLLPGGRRQGHEWVVGSGDSPFGCSLGVHLNGARAGLWSAWASSQKGDIFDLIAEVACAGDKKQALRWAKEWLRLPVEPQASAVSGGGNATHGATRALGEEVDGRARAARAIWLAARPLTPGDEVDAYLLCRGINIQQMTRLPHGLRYHPRLYHFESDRHWPAMVAAISRGGKIVAVHRTWLQHGAKAPVDNAKMTLGEKRGGLISLQRGASGKPLAQAEDGENVLISEGIEDGLTVAMAKPEQRVVAAIDLGNMACLELPPAIREIIIMAQRDPWWQDRAGFKNAARVHGANVGLDKAIRHFQSQGRRVRVAFPADGVKDINDMVKCTPAQEKALARTSNNMVRGAA